MTYRIRVSPRASRQIEKAADWWFENRPAAPSLFSEDIERGFLALATFPRAGESVAHPHIRNMRRILLSQVHYHLYYTISDDEKIVEILELWQTSRKEPTS